MIELALTCVLLEEAVLQELQTEPTTVIVLQRHWCPEPRTIQRRTIWRQDGVTFNPQEEVLEWVAPALVPPASPP